MIEHSPSIAALAKALHAAQGEIGGVVRDSANPAFKSRYATLDSVILATKGPLNRHGIAFTQAPGAMVDGHIALTTMLLHTSGEWMRSTVHVPLAKRDPQGLGSAITYACRYSLMAVCGLPPVDDDGEAAMLRGEDRPTRTTNAPPADAVARKLVTELRASQTEAQLRQWHAANGEAVTVLPESQRDVVRTAYAEKLNELRRAAA